MRGFAVVLLFAYLAVAGAILYRSPASASALSMADSVEYAVGAYRLVHEGRYDLVLDGRIHPPRYPPGFSLLFLAPVYWLGGDTLGLGILPVLASVVFSLAVVAWLCRTALPGEPGVAAAALLLPALLSVHWLPALSRQIMPDVPLLALSLAALLLFRRALERPGWPLFLAAGLLAGAAGSLRLTGFGLCLPFLWLAFSGTAAGRLGRAASLLVPVAAAGAGLLVYQDAVFGHPLYTGYHYWLPPDAYRLAPAHLLPNLLELSNPFRTPEYAGGRGGAAFLVGPLVALAILAAGLRCRARRPGVWRRTRAARIFWLTAALPQLVFFLFYPFHSARFGLLAHVLAVSLGGIWGVALAERLPAAALRAAAVAGLAAALWLHPPDPIGGDWYRGEAIEAADRILPADGCLVTLYHAIFVEFRLMRDGRRCHVALNASADFVGWRVGRYGEPRRAALGWSAAESPERIEALLRSDRRVFVEMLQPLWSGQQQSLDSFLAHFATESVWRPYTLDALVEIRLREAASAGAGAR